MADLSSVGSWYSPANSASWELQLQPNGTARFAVAGPDAGAGTTFVSGGVATTQRVNDGQWHRLGAVRNGTELRLYRDGQMEGFWNFLNGPPVLTSLPAGGLRIGTGGCGTNPFTGQLDEITMADRAWTVAELQSPRTQEQPVATYVYDALSRRIATTLSNGTQTTYSYDPASQVTNILHQLTATSTQINQAAYAYNGVGNRTSLTDRRGAQAFGYDNLDRLTSASHPLLATPQSFAYDAVGNQTTTGAVLNAGNQLTADATHSYQYDDNGNLTRKTLLATGNYTQYTYDAENRLIKVEDFAAGNPTPAFTSTYRYDGLGRRIEKVANGQMQRYIYDGEDILLEYDGANVLQARYTHGPTADEPIAVTKGGNTFFYHADGLGTVTELTDSTGTVAKAYGYDSYGNILETTGSLDQSYGYSGREFDQESGLYYYRARYYDPSNGRFLQKDPIGLYGGINTYRYVRNNPPNGTDSSGLAPNLPPQGVQPSSSKPESMIGGPAGSIICQDGNPEVWISDYFKDDNSQECGITECIFAHEGFHLQDALGRRPLVCSGTKGKRNEKNGGQILFREDIRTQSEISAYLIEQECLQKQLDGKRGNCPCEGLLNSRIDIVRKAFKGL